MRRRTFLGSVFAGFVGLKCSPSMISKETQEGLVGHWKLEGDCRDYSGQGNHGVNHGVDLETGKFNGIDGYIEVAHHESLRFESGDLSFCAWVQTQQDMDDVVGDLLSKYDPSRRKGFTVSIKASSGGYNSQGNDKHVYFGIDDGSEISWEDCGRCSDNSNFVNSLTVYRGRLYAGTTDSSLEEDWCHVYRYEGGGSWEDCGRVGKLRTRGVGPMIVHNGDLYAGTWNFAWPADEARERGNCHVYRYRGDREWEDCGQPGLWGMASYSGLWSMASYRGQLYVLGCGPWGGQGVKSKCYVYEGGDQWKICGEWENTYAHPLAIHDGKLYTGVHGGEVYAYDGEEWKCLGNPLGSEECDRTGGSIECDQIHSMEVYRGALHVGMWPRGNVAAYRGGRWHDCGSMGQSTEPNGLTVYNGKLFAGSIPWAEVYRYDGDEGWTLIRRFLSHAPKNFRDLKHYREWARVTSLTVYDGKLFASTSSATGSVSDAPLDTPDDMRGKVFSAEAGKCVSYDDDLGAGLKQVVAVKQGGRLKLYIDGEPAVTSSLFDTNAYSLSNQEPVQIGLGATDYFSGRMRDVRLYNRALNAGQVKHLYSVTRSQLSPEPP